MQEFIDAIHQQSWTDIERLWMKDVHHQDQVALLSTLKVQPNGEFSIPEWLQEDAMVIPLLGLLAQRFPSVVEGLKEIRLEQHHHRFPSTLRHFPNITLLHVEHGSFTDLTGISDCQLHTLVLTSTQLHHNLDRIAQIKGLRVLIVSSDDEHSLTVQDVCQKIPLLEELYCDLALGADWCVRDNLRYIAFQDGYFFFAAEAGSFQHRLRQAKIAKLPEGTYPHLELLEDCHLTLNDTASCRFPKMQVVVDHLQRLSIHDSFWQCANAFTRMQLGNIHLILTENTGPICERITQIFGALPSCACPNLTVIDLPTDSVRLDETFVQRYPSIEYIRCFSATYASTFWSAMLPIKTIEETGHYPRFLSFEATSNPIATRLKRLYCNYRWLHKSVHHFTSVTKVCVYQCQNLAAIVRQMPHLEELYTESLPYGKEADFQSSENIFSVQQKRLIAPYAKSWRKRLAIGGFGFMFVHRKQQKRTWERWTVEQQARFTAPEHMYNFSYCWDQGYRSARFCNRVTYDDDFLLALAESLESAPFPEMTWLQSFRIVNGYFLWDIELRHRNGRSQHVKQTDLLEEKRRAYFRSLFAQRHPALRKLSYFSNLLIPEQEALDLHAQAFQEEGATQKTFRKKDVHRYSDKQYLLSFFPPTLRKAVIRPEFLPILPTILQRENCTRLTIHVGQSTLPPEIFQATHLQELNLSHCNVRSLPESIGSLVHLEKLLLWGNELRGIPPVLQNLTNLKVLSLSNNPIDTLPPELIHLHSLERLYISNTNIVELPQWLANLPNLLQLDVKGLQLQNPSMLLRLVEQGIDVRTTPISEPSKDVSDPKNPSPSAPNSSK